MANFYQNLGPNDDYPLYPSPLPLPNKAKKSLLFRPKWTSMVHCTHQCTIHCVPIIIQLWQWFLRLEKKKLLISFWESPSIPNCFQIYEKKFKENQPIISKPLWKLDPMDLFKMRYAPNTGSYTCFVFCLFPSDPCKKPLYGGLQHACSWRYIPVIRHRPSTLTNFQEDFTSRDIDTRQGSTRPEKNSTHKAHHPLDAHYRLNCNMVS